MISKATKIMLADFLSQAAIVMTLCQGMINRTFYAAETEPIKSMDGKEMIACVDIKIPIRCAAEEDMTVLAEERAMTSYVATAATIELMAKKIMTSFEAAAGKTHSAEELEKTSSVADHKVTNSSVELALIVFTSQEVMIESKISPPMEVIALLINKILTSQLNRMALISCFWIAIEIFIPRC